MVIRVVVTGANGFVGRAVCSELASRGHEVVACVRKAEAARNLTVSDVVESGALEQCPDLSAAFQGADAVVHTANWSGGAGKGISAQYIEDVNVRATAWIGATAAKSGVGQFVYISSIKAMGNATGRAPFKLSTIPQPTDEYGRSKLEAERVLLKIGGLPITVIRPPLLYGPGVSGGMLRLFQFAARGVPLPLRSVRNARDLLAVQSLADLIAHCIERPVSSSRTLLARDGQAISSGELYRRVAASLGRSARLFSVPPSVLRRGAALVGQEALAESLLSSLEIDDRDTVEICGWKPSRQMDDVLKATGLWYSSGRSDVYTDGPIAAPRGASKTTDSAP